MQDALFVAGEPEPDADGYREAVIHLGRCGYAAELRVQAHLLELGHNVAVPVVDDDGVDLIVDYRTTVQVRATQAQSPDRGYLHVHLGNGRRDHRRRWLAADVLVVLDRRLDVFYVFPREELPRTAKLLLTPKYEAYRGAWGVFERAAA